MKYQLVLQWPASSIQDYDVMVEIEDILIENLSGSSEVDGHDAGLSEMNIFILTDDPILAFDEIKRTLGGQNYWANARVAYREVTKSSYTILWPKDTKEFKVN